MYNNKHFVRCFYYKLLSVPKTLKNVSVVKNKINTIKFNIWSFKSHAGDSERFSREKKIWIPIINEKFTMKP